MNALIPILYVLIVDIIFASIIYGTKTSGKKIAKDKEKQLITKLLVYVLFHLTFMTGIYCISQTGTISWYDNLVQGKEGSIVFYLLNFIIYTTMMFLYDLINPVANYILAFRVSVGIFILCLILSIFIPNFRNDGSLSENDPDEINMSIQPEGYPFRFHLNPGQRVNFPAPLKHCYKWNWWGQMKADKLENNAFVFEADSTGADVIIFAICEKPHHKHPNCPLKNQRLASR